MPFQNLDQMKACFAKNDPNWDCHEWAKETKSIKKLPKKIKKEAELKITTSFQKIAKSLFNPQSSPSVPSRVIMNNAIQDEKMKKTKGMSPVEYRNELTSRRTGIVQKNTEPVKGI